jgi:hypothetical protein
MKKTLFLVTLALAGYGPAYAVDLAIESAEVDHGECEVVFADPRVSITRGEDESGGLVYPNGKVVANPNWIIGECHIKLTKAELISIGGPFQFAKHFWDFPCSTEIDGVTGEDPVAIVSHAVLTPSGVLNYMCVAPFEPLDPEQED